MGWGWGSPTPPWFLHWSTEWLQWFFMGDVRSWTPSHFFPFPSEDHWLKAKAGWWWRQKFGCDTSYCSDGAAYNQKGLPILTTHMDVVEDSSQQLCSLGVLATLLCAWEWGCGYPVVSSRSHQKVLSSTSHAWCLQCISFASSTIRPLLHIRFDTEFTT